MSVRKRPESKFYQYRFKHNGVSWEGSTNETQLPKALKVEALMRAKVIRGELTRETLDMPTLEGFAPEFLKYVEAHQSLSPSTKKHYRNGWVALSKTPLAKRKLSEIGTAAVETLALPGSGSTQNRAIHTLRRMLSLAASSEQRLIQSAPECPLREERKRKAVLSEPWQEDILLELAHPLLRDLIIIGKSTGMRPEEYCSLKWEQVLWLDNQIRIDAGKSDDAERCTILTTQCAAMLRERKRTSTSEYVFASTGAAGYLSPTSPSHAFADLKKKVHAECLRRNLPVAWLNGLVLYSLRHTFATNFQAAVGGDRAKAAEVMGHASTSMLDRYTHPSTGRAAADMDAWEASRRKLVEIKRA